MNAAPSLAIYAIHDTLADSLLGILQTFKHEAAAIRFFGDVASQPDTVVHKHIEDYSLVRLGFLSDDHQLSPDFAVIITGSAWAASQQKANDNNLQLTG